MPLDHWAIFERLADAMNRHAWSELEELFTEDYVEEYPQSGEVIRGSRNARASRENYPGGLEEGSIDFTEARLAATEARWVITRMFTVMQVEGTGNVGTVTFKTRYPDRSEWWIVILYELRGERIAKATTFFAPVFEAPEWRRPYVELPAATVERS